MPRSSNNVRAGAFLLVTIALGFACVIVLSGVADSLKRRERYTVRFPLAVGASGVEEGSLVLIGGRNVGRVERVLLRTQREGEIAPGVDCVILVDAGIRFFGKPVAYLERPLLGAGATLNFASVGDAAAEPPVGPGAVFRGDVAAPSFLAQAGYGDEQKGQLQEILRNGKKISDDIAAVASDLRDNIAPDIRAVVADARQRSPQWFDRIDSVTSNADDFSKKLPAIGEDVKEIAAKVRARIDENSDRFDRIFANADKAAATMNEETLPLTNNLMREGRAAVADARTAIERLDAFVAEEEPGLRKSLANARLASDQLRLTLAEVRRSPWRLLYRPDTKEVEFELLYDAARTYADAVSDLRAASDSLKAVGAPANHAASPPDSDRVRGLVEQVQKSFEVYREAEERFLNLVIGQGEKKD